MGSSIQTSRWSQSAPLWIDDSSLEIMIDQVSEDTYFFGVTFDMKQYVLTEGSGYTLPADAPMENAISGVFLTGADLSISSDGNSIDGDIESFKFASLLMESLDASDYLFNYDLGSDTVSFSDLIEAFSSPEDFLYGFNGSISSRRLTDVWTDDVEKLTVEGTEFNDVIDNEFTDMKVVIEGFGGDDVLSLYGSYGRIDGGEGADTIHGYGADDAKFSSLSDSETISILQGGEGRDDIYYYYGVNNITGHEGGDTIIFAGTDSDEDYIEANILGKEGADYIEVGGDMATVSGNGGKDTLVLGAQTNVASGGVGADTFEFDIEMSGLIRIRDFEIGVDTLDTNGTLSVEEFAELANDTINGHVKFVIGDLQVSLIDTDLATLLDSDFLL